MAGSEAGHDEFFCFVPRLDLATPAKKTNCPPGEIRSEEFMKPHGLSQNRLALDLNISPAFAKPTADRSSCGGQVRGG